MRVLLVILFATTAFADPTPDQLAKDRADAAGKVYTHRIAELKAGTTTLDDTVLWSLRWVDASLDAPKPNAKQILADHLKRMQDLDTLVASRVNAGAASSVETDIIAFYKSEAQLWVARGKK